MNKWMQRFWGLLALVSLAMLIATTAWPAPPAIGADWPVTPNPSLALESMLGFLRVPDESNAERKLTAYHKMLRRAAAEEPRANRAADVLLRRGLNASEIERLLMRHGLEYLSCEAKMPLADGTSMKMWSFIGGPMMPLPGVSVSELVERDLGRWRYRFMHDSRLDLPPDMAAKRREIAQSREVGVYRVEVVGTQRALLALLKEPDVSGVVAEVDDARARGYEELKARALRETPVYRSRVPPDPGESSTRITDIPQL